MPGTPRSAVICPQRTDPEFSAWPHPTHATPSPTALLHTCPSSMRTCRFPVSVWFDGPNERMRIEVMNGLDTTITVDVSGVKALTGHEHLQVATCRTLGVACVCVTSFC